MIEEPGIKRGIKVTGGSFEQGLQDLAGSTCDLVDPANPVAN
jgi:hypothetical protein